MHRKASTLALGCLWGVFVAGVVLGAPPRPPLTGPGDANIISPKLCFTLSIPGDWLPGDEQGTYHSPDGKQFVGVLVFSAQDLKRSKGNTLLEKEGAALEQAYQKALRRKLTDVKVLPFESPMQGTWKWVAALPSDGEPGIRPPKRFFVDLSPEGIVVLNIQGTPDDDDLARRIIRTVRQGKGRPCQLPTSLDKLIKEVPEKPDPPAGSDRKPGGSSV